MSPLAIPSSTAALPAMNVHPHGHGHKKGSPVDSAADSSSTAGQSPVGSTQNLFSRLFNSLAQVIGAQPARAAQATRAAQPVQPAQSAQAAQLAIGSKINTTA
jgi:hypothetical protein